jgi:hypothetical protein
MAGMPWILAAVIALVCFSGAFLLMGRLGGQLGPLPLTAWLLALQAVPAAGHLAVSGERPWMPWSTVPVLLLAAGLCYAGNLAQTGAITRAPNPGFALAIIGANTGVVALVAALAGGAPLGPGKLAGIGLCLAGVAVVSLTR